MSRRYFEYYLQPAAAVGGTELILVGCLSASPENAVGAVSLSDLAAALDAIGPPTASDMRALYKGMSRWPLNPTVTSDGVDVTFTLQLAPGAGGTDPEFWMDDGWVVVLAGTRVELSQGTPAQPLSNYVYVDDTGELRASSSGFPEELHAPVAVITIRDAASVQSGSNGLVQAVVNEGVLCDHEGTGLLQAMISASAQRPAVLVRGGGLTTTLVPVPAGMDRLELAVGEALLSRVRSYPFPAQAPGSPMMLINSDADPYKSVTALGPPETLVTADGVPIPNRDYGSWVLSAAVGDDGAPPRLLLALPKTTTAVEAVAVQDSDGGADYSLPPPFVGSAVPLARLVVRVEVNAETLDLVHVEDLRQRAAGSGGGSGGATFFDEDFRLISTGDPAGTLALDLGALSTEVTLTAPASSGVLPVLIDQVPANSGSPGVKGQLAVDASGIYVHDGARWHRSATDLTF
jgi:hypothetical protein